MDASGHGATTTMEVIVTALIARSRARLLLPALVPLVGGCAASISMHVSEPIRPAQVPQVAILAVMPATVEPGSEWVRTETMQRLVLELTERYPGLDIIGPEAAAQRLAARSLAREYASVLRDFDRAGVVDPGRVEEVLDAVGATHFLHIRVAYTGEGLERAATNFDGSLLFYSTKHQTLYAIARLWESSATGPSWEAVARSESEAGPLSRDRRPIDLIDSVVLSVAESIPLATPLGGAAAREPSRE